MSWSPSTLMLVTTQLRPPSRSSAAIPSSRNLEWSPLRLDYKYLLKINLFISRDSNWKPTDAGSPTRTTPTTRMPAIHSKLSLTVVLLPAKRVGFPLPRAGQAPASSEFRSLTRSSLTWDPTLSTSTAWFHFATWTRVLAAMLPAQAPSK